MNKYKVSWYDDAFKIVKNMGYNGSICEPVY